jgi:hypothetical protein
VSAVRGALDAHLQAAAMRQRAEHEMGSRWRDAAAHVVEVRFLEPLARQDREFSATLQDLDDQIQRALDLINQ